MGLTDCKDVNPAVTVIEGTWLGMTLLVGAETCVITVRQWLISKHGRSDSNDTFCTTCRPLGLGD